jgi:Methyltransferase domain
MRVESRSIPQNDGNAASAGHGLLARSVEPEYLDALLPTDPGAIQSRRDLQRVNWFMGSARILAAALKNFRPRRIVELGAGDGTLLLELAQRVSPAWWEAELLLLDLHPLIKPPALQRFSESKCRAVAEQADVREWLTTAPAGSCDLMIANLFLHHFREEELKALLGSAARVTTVFVALEPHRNRLSLAFCRLLWAIGCNSVTRHDAAASVRAGFRGQELSRCWPSGEWRLQERAAGCFSHLFVAVLSP